MWVGAVPADAVYRNIDAINGSHDIAFGINDLTGRNRGADVQSKVVIWAAEIA